MYKLLIADDEYEIRNGLSSYFPWEDIGFKIIGQAANGVEVLEFICDHSVDVILSDIRMPEMSGIDVAKKLFEQNSPIIVVFLSGYKDFNYAQQAINFGVKSYISKPTKYSELSTIFSRIKEELDQKKKSKHSVQKNMGIDKTVEIIQKYIHENYKEASLEGASQLVHMNPYYISKYFKEKTGGNFSDYVVSMKMKKAAELLSDMQLKVYEISEMVGYSNSKNFTRSFRKHFGKTPREYRNEE
ncbi:response regulator [Psychrobacillus sp. L4]|uniref:response regulator transcription factor n=1 Tax=Psychrobacillus sp. L4 TaxID=3236892 RepID=UPI0036F3CD6E